MLRLQAWRLVARLPGVSEASSHLALLGAEFGLPASVVRLEKFCVGCSGGHVNVKVEGGLAKESAVYVPTRLTWTRLDNLRRGQRGQFQFSAI